MKTVYPRILCMLTGLLLTFLSVARAQAPHQFAFQGVARDAAGKVLANRNIALRISIRPTSALGTPVYQETQKAQTSANGVFTISVGAGMVQTGVFNEVKWNTDKFFLQTELDPEGGENFINLGATQLLSVPYSLHAAEAGKWQDDAPIVQIGKKNSSPVLPAFDLDGGKSLLIWHPRKGAFRAGGVELSAAWQDENIGYHSFAAGKNTMASGISATALGSGSNALGIGSIAAGAGVSARENYSVAFGRVVHAVSEGSVGIGNEIVNRAKFSYVIGTDLVNVAMNGIVLGVANDTSDLSNNVTMSPSDRLLQLGNGSSSIRSNALTILRNGNVGIGNNVLSPTHILDVGNRMRIRSNPNNITAGIWLDDANNFAYSFIGGFDNNHVGFYFENGGWRFTVNKNGNAFLGGSLTQNSDLRLKRDILPLKFSFDKLSAISGRNYYWKDPQRSQSLQTGLIAQEVEGVFPELVETDKDGYKSVNYIGLIPHLLEAVKELKQENSRLDSENKKLTSNAAGFDDLKKRLEVLEANFTKNPTASVK